MDNPFSDRKALLQEVVNLKNFIYSENVWYIEEIEKSNYVESINDLEQRCKKCFKCSLSKSRHNVVFGDGNPSADLMLIGEAPGHNEDMQGLPFVGDAGELLTKMLKAINIDRKDVFICNVLKCRPPRNRNPLPEEIEQCSPYLDKQIELIKPKVIFTLGKFASQFVLKTNEGITRIRGQIFHKDNVIIIPSFHPSALLHDASKKKYSWQDLKLLKRTLEELSV